jgi:tetratricopeptide (TPR) repeat protein
MMMSNIRALEERVFFAREIKPEVNACLQQAVASANDFEKARSYLYKARDLDPDQLEVYIALYKFCFYRGYLAEAQQVALDALETAARRGDFDKQWLNLDADSTDWTVEDGPARVYLYSLKALGFIRLRIGNMEGAREVLEILMKLDPDDRVGGSVIMSLAEAV